MTKLLKPIGNGKIILTEKEALEDIEGVKSPAGNAFPKQVSQQFSSDDSLDGLVFACGKEIMCVKDKKVYVIAGRGGYTVNALAVFDNKLYDAGDYDSVYETLSNTKVTTGNFGCVASLAVFQNKLHEGRQDNNIYETFTGVRVVKRSGRVNALAVLSNKFYDAVGDEIYRDFSGRPVVSRVGFNIQALAAFDNTLYDAGNYGMIYHTFSGQVIARRTGSTNALAVLKNKLYDAGNYDAIYDTINDFEGKNPLFKIDKIITAMCAVPLPLFDELRKNAKKVWDVP